MRVGGCAARAAERGADNGYSQLKAKLLATSAHSMSHAAFLKMARECAAAEGLADEHFNRILTVWTQLLHQEVMRLTSCPWRVFLVMLVLHLHHHHRPTQVWCLVLVLGTRPTCRAMAVFLVPDGTLPRRTSSCGLTALTTQRFATWCS